MLELKSSRQAFEKRRWGSNGESKDKAEPPARAGAPRKWGGTGARFVASALGGVGRASAFGHGAKHTHVAQGSEQLKDCQGKAEEVGPGLFSQETSLQAM